MELSGFDQNAAMCYKLTVLIWFKALLIISSICSFSVETQAGNLSETGFPVRIDNPWAWVDVSQSPAFQKNDKDFPKSHPWRLWAEGWVTEVDRRLRVEYPELDPILPRPHVVFSLQKKHIDNASALVAAVCHQLPYPVVSDVESLGALEGDLKSVELSVSGGVRTHKKNQVCISKNVDTKELPSFLDFVEFHSGCTLEKKEDKNGSPVLVLQKECQERFWKKEAWKTQTLLLHIQTNQVVIGAGTVRRMRSEGNLLAILAHELIHLYAAHASGRGDYGVYYQYPKRTIFEDGFSLPTDFKEYESLLSEPISEDVFGAAALTSLVEIDEKEEAFIFSPTAALMPLREAYQRAKGEKISRYTIEQEADEYVVYLLQLLGVPLDHAVFGYFDFLPSYYRKEGEPKSLVMTSRDECEKKWMDDWINHEDGTLYYPPFGVFSRHHPDECHRIYHLSHSIRALRRDPLFSAEPVPFQPIAPEKFSLFRAIPPHH